jgi:hypothetical protein
MQRHRWMTRPTMVDCPSDHCLTVPTELRACDLSHHRVAFPSLRTPGLRREGLMTGKHIVQLYGGVVVVWPGAVT